MILEPKDLHCIARVLQSNIFAEGERFFCCRDYCRYREECAREFKENKALHFTRVVRPKLQEITGVYLGMDACNIEEKFLLSSELINNKPENRQGDNLQMDSQQNLDKLSSLQLHTL